jgi:hypothetical protein
MVPNEPSYALTLSVVRHPENFCRGQIRLKGADTSEKRGTPVRRISMVMTIDGQAIFQRHPLPPTPNEGGIYALTEEIELPLYGTHFFNLWWKIYIPVMATIATETEELEDDWALDEKYPATPSASVVHF